jgi:rubredoxin
MNNNVKGNPYNHIKKRNPQHSCNNCAWKFNPKKLLVGGQCAALGYEQIQKAFNTSACLNAYRGKVEK